MKAPINYFKSALILVLAIFVAYVIYIVLHGVGQFADTLRGYEIINQMNVGGECNTLSYPSVQKPIYSYFVTWWSPAQWVLPYLLIKIGASIQVAQGILIVVFTAIGLWSSYRLFQHLEFSKVISIVSVLLIASNAFVGHQFIQYTGGDLFAFGLLPLFILIVLKSKDKSWFLFGLTFIVSIVLGSFFKNTFLLYAAALTGALILSEIRNVLKFTIPSIVGAAIVYFGFLQFGETPGSSVDIVGYGSVTNSFFNDVFIPIGSLLGSVFNGDGIIKVIGEGYSLGLYVLLSLITAMILFFSWKKTLSQNGRVILIFTVVFTLLMMILFLRDSAVSYNSRHFAPVTFLLIPFILKLVEYKLKKWMQLSLILGLVLFGLLITGLRMNSYTANYSDYNGYHVTQNERDIIEGINRWSKNHPDGLVILRDRWHLMPLISAKNKISIKGVSDSSYVVSGMELNYADHFDIQIIHDFSPELLMLNKGEICLRQFVSIDLIDSQEVE